MKLHVSNVCRTKITPSLANLVTGPGIHAIPEDVLPPRQIRVLNQSITIPAILKFHRDAHVATIVRRTAERLVWNKQAEYVPQSLLVYSIDEYLADPDVQSNDTEHTLASEAKAEGAECVVVAVIGESRSPLSVCRNIASGCQDIGSVEVVAKNAVEAASIFLIEG